jgi:hypothetical protein
MEVILVAAALSAALSLMAQKRYALKRAELKLKKEV